MSDAGGRLVLASDLDGTLAHGAAESRALLTDWLRARPDSTLIYVTGRTPAATRELCARVGLPEPDVLITDVGTSVLRGFGPSRVSEIEDELERLWPGGQRVRDRLAPLADELSEQDVRAPRRVSYWVDAVRRMRAAAKSPDGDEFSARAVDDPSLSAEAAALATGCAQRARDALDGLGVDVLVSANVFLDVLPRGVHKGSTLRRVLRWLGAADEECVVAGDSLNDLALFETGMRGISVGNCEPGLRRFVTRLPRVYQAKGEGVVGVLEGLSHFGHAPGSRMGGDEHGE